jgi:hypothetical protein
MKWIRPPDAAIRKATVAASALTFGALLGVGAHWTSTEDSGPTQVTVTVLQPGEPHLGRAAIGQWTTPEGERRFGAIPAPCGHPAGAEHLVWIDQTGHITQPPASRVARTVRASLAGATGTVAVFLVTRLRLTAAGQGPRQWRACPPLLRVPK